MHDHKLAIITSHPIQYNAPLFKELSKRILIKVFYTLGSGMNEQYDAGFGKNVKWDIPLLEGYNYTFVGNTSNNPSTKQFYGIVTPTLINEIESWGATSVLVYGWAFKSHLKAMRYFKGKIPVLFRGDSHLLDEANTIKKVLRRIFLTWVYNHIDTALYVGTNNKLYYLKHGVKEKQLIWAPHAVDNAYFQANDQQREKDAKKWRKKLGICDSDTVVLFAGKLEPKKNPNLLLDAINELKNSKLHLIFVGSGILEQELKSKAKQNVHFLGFQNQSIMPVIYRLGDVFCLPSSGPGETWGLAVNEAMACGKPVIVSNKVGCAIDLVHTNENGYIFQSNKPLTLKNLISQLLDKQKIERFRTSSIHFISNWNIEVATKKILNALNLS